MPFSDPDRARRYQREYRRTRRAGDRCTTPVHPAVPLPFRLQTTQDVLDLLQEQVALVRAETSAGALEKARTVGYLATVTLKAQGFQGGESLSFQGIVRFGVSSNGCRIAPRRRMPLETDFRHLGSPSLKAIEAGNLAARIEMLESVLKLRDKRKAA